MNELKYAGGQDPQPGDTVIFGVEDSTMSAYLGARATVKGVTNFYGGPYIEVEWDRHQTGFKETTQSDGSYYAHGFILIERAPMSNDTKLEMTLGELKKIFSVVDPEDLRRFVKGV